MFLVFFANFIANKYVVQIYLTELIDKIEQKIVHIMLLIDEIVRQFKRQHVILIYV